LQSASPDEQLKNEIEGLVTEVYMIGSCNGAERKDISMDKIRKQHKAVYIATGTQFSNKVGIPGEELSGVYHGLAFLRDVNLGKKPVVGKKAVVIGGDNTAIDAARALVRLGCGDVTILYRRRIEDMPADRREVIEAKEEGIKIIALTAPVELSGKDKVNGIKCMRMELGELDADRRRLTKTIKGSEFTTGQ
jgi:NADH-quinone oxidoreductase subunit F